MSVPGKRTQTELKQMAQDVLLDAVSKALGYYDPNDYGTEMPPIEREKFDAVMKREADRVAKLFGYDEAWSS